MKYGRIDAAAHKLDVFSAETWIEAEHHCGLESGRTDHGVIMNDRTGGIAIVVAEFGLYVPPLNQHYFAIGDRLFAGNALIYAFGEAGETVDFDDVERLTIRWFESGHDVARALARGDLIKPQIVLNGMVVWEWPQPRPDMGRLGRLMAGS